MSNSKDLKLPSNRKFGLFFSAIFLVLLIYSLFFSLSTYSIIFLVLFFITLLITLFFSELLTPFNKLWMKIGYLIGGIINPLVMGAIYFIFFTPISLLFKLTNRDYLGLKYNSETSYWVKRTNKSIDPMSFKNQF
tara:strand:- start:1133 stop:1537 length:405 start_codon:yes stop_codon:yes gene_type:complete